MSKNIEIIELRLGFNIADEIRKKTESMAKIDLGTIPKPVIEQKQDPWAEKCEIISTILLTDDSGISKGKICELINIKDSQLSTFTGKLRSYLRTNHNANLVKTGNGAKVVYIARRQEQPLPASSDQPQSDQGTENLVDLIWEDSESDSSSP